MKKKVETYNDKAILPRNDKGQRHGYWEQYWRDGSIFYKSFYYNGRRIGYEEYHFSRSKALKVFFIR